MPKSTILVVDKEKILVDLLVRALSSDDIKAFGTTSTEEALRLLEMQSPALVVIDPTIPGGFNLVDAVVLSRAKALVVSGSPDVAERAREAGVREIVDRNARRGDSPHPQRADSSHGQLRRCPRPGHRR